MEDLLHTQTWVIYLCAFVGPFVQEDLAVIGAVSAILHQMGNPLGVFVSISIGLMLSDMWKYWLGRAAITRAWARKYSEKPSIHAAREKLDNNMFKTIFISRFLPGARIPLYIAAGFFKIPFSKFALSIVLTALFYIGFIYTIFFALGEIAGEPLKTYLPIASLSAVVIYLIVNKVKKQRVKVQEA